MKRILSAALLLLSATVFAAAPYSYKDILRLESLQRSVYGLRSMNDGEHYTTLTDGSICRFAYSTGELTDTLYRAAEGLKVEGYEFSDDENAILISASHRPVYRRSFTADYYIWSPSGSEVPKALAPQISGKRDAVISPDNRRVGFVADNDIYLADLRTGEVRRVTEDGERNAVINGATDWVYEEEFAFTRAFEFSPDGSRVAYLRFDESDVPEFEMMRFDGQLYNHPYRYKYPKAGERNSTVELYVYDIATGERTRIDTGTETDQYIPHIGWTPRGELYFFRENRLQNRFEVLTAAADGSSRVIYEESSPRYVERVDEHTVTFLPDGDRFIVRNETESGYMHLYLYSISRGRLRALTSGDWEVTEVVEVTDDRVYYISTETSPLRRNLYSVRLNGKDKRRLTERDGYYRIAPSRGMRYFISYFSSADEPTTVTLHRAGGETVRVLEANTAYRQAVKNLPRKEFFTFTTERGDRLNGYMVRPRDFDPANRYPVLMTQYSGPGSQSVADSWTLGWEDAMALNGYIVVCVDGRGTGFRGEEFKKCTYGQLGRLEVEDQISTARYMASQPYVDPDRIGIYGWSYGGFMALGTALRGGDLFRMAIAVAPVTSWRYYDSIYTEVYNGLPESNAAGYDDNSPINFAGGLSDRTRLLIIHGTGDDNVHFQNTIEMVRALNAAGKMFDLAVYPDNNHSMVPDGRVHIRERMVEYCLRNL